MTSNDVKKVWCEHIYMNEISQSYFVHPIWPLTDEAKFCPICGTPKPVEKELAQKLYQGFYASLVYGGTGIWSDLLESQRAAWRAVASAATEHFKEKP